MCGIAAYATGKPRMLDQAAKQTLSMLVELQHRGQEAAGIAFVDGSTGDLRAIEKGSLALDLYSEFLWGNGLPNVGTFGCIGYTRYTSSNNCAAMFTRSLAFGSGKLSVAVAFSGAVVNSRELCALAKSVAPELPECSGSSAQALLYAIYALAKEEKWDVVEALRRLPEHVIGAYSLVLLSSEPRLVVARDPRGFRPVSYSHLDTEMFIASETSALQVFDLEWAEVREGEVVSFDGGSVELTRARVLVEPSPCVFEYVYISRPDTYFNGISVYEARVEMGKNLAKVASVSADSIIPVPDSARPIAIGYSLESGIPLEEGLVVNKYVGRVFISSPDRRSPLSRLKYGVVKPVIDGKKVIVIDDSIVRGTTLCYLVSKIRKAGAREIHVRIASPQFRCPCFMGVDIASRSELFVWGRSSDEELKNSLGADSLAYNTIQNLVNSVGRLNVCHACFSCSYRFFGLSVEELERASRG